MYIHKYPNKFAFDTMVTDCLYLQVQSQLQSVGWALCNCQVVGMAFAAHQHIQDKHYNKVNYILKKTTLIEVKM